MIKVSASSISIDTRDSLMNYLSHHKFDAIVVEGYDGVGKGRILSMIANHYGVTPYRPDYNLWQQHDLRPEDRWKISGFFWDIYSYFNYGSKIADTPMLFDRGVLSGAVYFDDISIAEHYKQLLRDKKVLHILVTCSEEDYKKFSIMRGVGDCDYEKYLEYTARYFMYMAIAGIDYIVFENNCDETEVEELTNTCAGCGHYSYGWCRHPIIDCRVDSQNPRCGLSTDSEVQDTV